MRYVTDRYLARIRPALISNLAMVVIKGLLRQDVPGWQGKEGRLMNTLSAISRAQPELWNSVVNDAARRILPNLDDAQRIRAFRLLGAESRFWTYAEETTRTQFRAILENMAVGPDQEVAFVVLGNPELQPLLMRAFDRADTARKAAIIEKHPHLLFMDEAIALLDSARTFRGAEAMFRSVITPMAGIMDEVAAVRILTSVMQNSQVWHAGAMPELLSDLATTLATRGKLIPDPWLKLIAFYREKSWDYAVERLTDDLRALGLTVPEPIDEEQQG